ncbi:hypothetical protein AN639_01855 [Candidatus Epulonipiscium fishelsonii]|uniref:Uncharacterized protein n=1 Tax=Candidatus Epulonipiscium fishelsonii TaxID=77094 RepID=A0ACC8X8C1_9FIRM|nr:hypothetical protein AN396_10815 [Epulopiscium sp. SCG-B11WGA-EpuloA1]ONI38949.1 hypothetical protein AN639_01855 [Epulopiscium sp. SCG-B05WGA-EpuloA1]
MNVLMMTNNYKPIVGGVPISIERLSEGLKSNGHNVNIFAPTYNDQIEEEGITRYRSCKKTISNMTIPNIFDRNIEIKFKTLDIDVIHVHHPNFIGWTALYLGKKYNIPVVYTYHTRYEHYVHNLTFIKNSRLLDWTKTKAVPFAIKNFINMCDRVIAPTDLIKEVLEDMEIKIPIDVLPTGIPNEFFKVDPKEVIKIKNKYNVKHLFCTVSRLSKEKNIDFILRGISVLKQRIGDDFKLLIIGEGQEKEHLVNLAAKLNIIDQIEFVGNVANDVLKIYYNACDLFVFASKSETQGIVLIEAMAGKLPVVAVEASGVTDIVENGKNGYMTLEDENDWSNRIIDIISNSKLHKTLSCNAIDTANNYTADKIAIKAKNIYSKALENVNNVEFNPKILEA